MLDSEARLAFDNLPDSRRRRYVEPIVQARGPEAREYRIARAIRMLRDERER
jgi:uncharacterized protein YdeI (YjbR/CyaY-like superfamily)